MTEGFTLIENLRACANDDERADWLRRCPDSIVAGHHDAVRAELVDRGFASAMPYLWARLATVQSVRLDDGRLPVEVEQNLVVADLRMGRRR